jgi:uncharacterized protein with HEPN domain
MKDKGAKSYERLLHIHRAIEQIEAFIRDVDEQTFLADPIISSAVLFQFSVIGEAVIHIDERLLAKYDYPWHKVRAFRNLISHAYFDIKLEAVWNIITNDLAGIKQIVGTILTNEFRFQMDNDK